jgi:hypothetical protein
VCVWLPATIDSHIKRPSYTSTSSATHAIKRELVEDGVTQFPLTRRGGGEAAAGSVGCSLPTGEATYTTGRRDKEAKSAR